MSCEKHKKLIEKYLDGIINEAELANLKSHVENCSACRNEFEQSKQLQGGLNKSMSIQTTAKEAKEAILSRLSNERLESTQKVLPSGRLAIAASILIAAGLLLGFHLGRVTSTQTIEPSAMKSTSKHSLSCPFGAMAHCVSALRSNFTPRCF